MFLGRTVFFPVTFFSLAGGGRSTCHFVESNQVSDLKKNEYSFLETNCSPFEVPVTLIYLTGGIKRSDIHYFHLSVNTPDFSCSVVFDRFLWLHC